jgi:uracil-DNA glycosylase
MNENKTRYYDKTRRHYIFQNEKANGKSTIKSSKAKRVEFECIKESNIGYHQRNEEWLHLIDTYRQKIQILKNPIPSENNVFKMFELLPYDSIKVVIIGQEPYRTKCNITKINYSCGPAFMIPDSVKTCPVSLKNLLSELAREYKLRKSVSIKYVKDIVKHWIYQGVFLTNVSLTIGDTSTYLDDHKMFWMSFMISFLQCLSDIECPIVLLGTEAWELSKFISEKNPVLKFPHPSSRNNDFLNCGIFEKVNKILADPIIWFI